MSNITIKDAVIFVTGANRGIGRAIAAGASIASHVNDSGFWLVNRYLGLTVPQTLRTWTVATTLLSLIGLVMTMLIGLFVT